MQIKISQHAIEQIPALETFSGIILETDKINFKTEKPLTIDKLREIATKMDTTYHELVDIIGDDDYLQEEIEESIGCVECKFISELCYQIPNFTEPYNPIQE